MQALYARQAPAVVTVYKLQVKADRLSSESAELMSCVNRELGLGSHSLIPVLPASLINRTVSVDVKDQDKGKEIGEKKKRKKKKKEIGGKQLIKKIGEANQKKKKKQKKKKERKEMRRVGHQ